MPLLNESKVASYYDSIKFKDLNFEFFDTSPKKILTILKVLNPSKADGIDNMPGQFLKDGTDILARPISQLCNFSIKLSSFPRSCKIAKVKRFQNWLLKLPPHFATPHLFKNC